VAERGDIALTWSCMPSAISQYRGGCSEVILCNPTPCCLSHRLKARSEPNLLVNRRQIAAQWKEILRLTTSIKRGTVTASFILRKLGAYPRQNSLALALRELGRVERTLFTLEWLQSPELRRRVQVGLNKGEAKNALARAVFFNRLGELRDRTFENQRYRASGLNLVAGPSFSGTPSTWNGPLGRPCGAAERIARTNRPPLSMA
jgi:hypothetical protein